MLKTTGSLAELKRRIKVGTRLLCIENTYRPVLNGTERVVVQAKTVGFVWTTPGDVKEERSHTTYPKAERVVWEDENTVRIGLWDDRPEHHVRLRFMPDDPEAAVYEYRRGVDDVYWSGRFIGPKYAEYREVRDALVAAGFSIMYGGTKGHGFWISGQEKPDDGETGNPHFWSTGEARRLLEGRPDA